jgi:hypothetical protein
LDGKSRSKRGNRKKKSQVCGKNFESISRKGLVSGQFGCFSLRSIHFRVAKLFAFDQNGVPFAKITELPCFSSGLLMMMAVTGFLRLDVVPFKYFQVKLQPT